MVAQALLTRATPSRYKTFCVLHIDLLTTIICIEQVNSTFVWILKIILKCSYRCFGFSAAEAILEACLISRLVRKLEVELDEIKVGGNLSSEFL